MYEDLSYEDIRGRMLARVSDSLDKREGSVIYDTHSPTAIELKNLYIELDQLISNGYGDTASREFLILLCADRGIEPQPATSAVLQGKFTPASIGASVLVGKRFNIDQLNYVVTAMIDEAAGTYQVQCETPGTEGNRHFGSMLPMEYISGLKTAELVSVLIPGDDEEDTEALRQRYFNSFGALSFGGNRADYIENVKSVDGVGGVKVERAWNGDISPASLIPSSAVTTWYNGIVGSLSATVRAWLTAVYTAARDRKLTTGGTVLITISNSSDYGEASTASGGLVELVQETLDPDAGEGYGLAPIGHVVTVQSVSGVTVNIHITGIVYNTGYSWNTVREAVTNTIDAYLLSLRMDWEDTDNVIIRNAQIESRVLAVEGILDIDVVLINGADSNLTLEKYQVPVLGGVTND